MCTSPSFGDSAIEKVRFLLAEFPSQLDSLISSATDCLIITSAPTRVVRMAAKETARARRQHVTA